MRLLSLGDLHGRVGWTEELASRARSADVLILCGDLTSFGGVDDVRVVLEDLSYYCDSIFAIAGNCDSEEIEEHLTERGISLHGRGVRLDDSVALCGVSGSNRTPFRTPFEFTDEELSSALQSGWNQIESAPVRIIVHHAPPHKTKCDRTRFGIHVGVRGLKAFCEQNQPELVICGHIHEARGIDSIGSTMVVNGGMAARGHGVSVEILNGDLDIDLI